MDAHNRISEVCTARLCKNCQTLKFDDQAIGGYAAVSDHGKKHLQMRDREDDDHWYVELEYESHDFLPDLPILGESARLGCDMCGFLRDTIISKDYIMDENVQNFFTPSNTRQIEISMCYVWTAPNIDSSDVGILSLEVFFADDQTGQWCTIIFTVEGHKGMSTCVASLW
jgi:hypothetical protein